MPESIEMEIETMTKNIQYKNARRNKFTMINNDFLNDKNLTLQAKGLMAIFLSNSEDWEIRMSEIINRSKNGRDAHYKVINELINNDYFARVEIKEDNKFKEMIYIFSDDKEEVKEALEEYKNNPLAYINIDKRKVKKVEKNTDNTPIPENQDTGQNDKISIPKIPFTENRDTASTLSESQYNNNTKDKNTNLNNTNLKDSQSVSDDEYIPVTLKDCIEKNKDRLTELNININDVISHYKSVSNDFRLIEYTIQLERFLIKVNEKPRDFYYAMNGWLKQYIGYKNNFNRNKNTQRTEVVPDWLKEQKEQADKQEQPKQPKEEEDLEFLAERERLQAELKQYYKKD